MPTPNTKTPPTPSSLPPHSRGIKRKFLAFTLVELIVVITILVILGTIAFTSLNGYSGSARDSARISNLTNLKNGLDIFQTKAGVYPIPESYATLYLSGQALIYQGFVKDQVGNIAKISPNGVYDPSDKTMYTTYATTVDKKRMQLMIFLEDGKNILSFFTPSFVYGSALSDYSQRYPYTVGDNVGVLLLSETLSPIQETRTGSVDLSSTTDNVTVYFSNKTTSNGSGTVITTVYLNTSVASSSTGTGGGSDVVAGFFATGGTITYADGYRIHTFTSNGIFTPNGVGDVEYLVIGGGGGGGSSAAGNTYAGAGGGAGGYLYGSGYTVLAQAYGIIVGEGGTTGAGSANNGANSVFDTNISTGGGGGGIGALVAGNGKNGGSGGGSTYAGTVGTATAGQGNSGGPGAVPYGAAGAGGGAGGAGMGDTSKYGVVGGVGKSSSISGVPTYYAGGGGSGGYGATGGFGGNGGGGAGGHTIDRNGIPGRPNTGGGGGGAGGSTSGVGGIGGPGGSGIVIIRYPFTAKANGSCGSAESITIGRYPTTNLCSVGTSNPVDQTGSDGTFKWVCTGLNGGSDSVGCSATKAPNGYPNLTFVSNGVTYITTPGGCSDSSKPTCTGNWWDTTQKIWGEQITTSITSTSDGSGNTVALVELYLATAAAKYCADMEYGGYDDWFLPAIDQLVAMFANRATIGGFASNFYWSSTEGLSGYPRCQNFDGGTPDGGYGQTNNFYVRCIRKY